MKRFCLIVCVSMIAVLGFASFTWATEASVFDSAENIIIRACTNEYQVSAPPYSAFLDVRDSTGALIPVGTFIVNDISTGFPVPVSIAGNPFLVYSDLTNPTVSLTLDSDSGAAYLFRTNGTVDVTKYAITNLAIGHCAAATNGQTLATQPSGAALCDTGTASSVTTTATGWAWTCTGTTSASGTNPPKVVNCSANIKVDGACGSSNGQSFTTVPSSNLCSTGTASSVSGSGPWTWNCGGVNGGTTASCSATLKVNGACGTDSGSSFTSLSSTDANLCATGTVSSFAGTGPWNWSCNGSNGGTTASCSANKTVNGACGSSNGGSFTSAPTSNLCSTGTASSVSGSGPWNWSCAGSNGGTTASCSANTVTVNGACGSSNGQSVTSAPSTNLCSAGTASSVSGTGPWSWTCNGSGGGTNASCSASLQSTGSIDLDFTRSYGFVYGITTSGCTTNGAECDVTMSIINNGTGTAGSFNVKVWISASSTVDSSAQLIGTWSVSGMAGGQVRSGTVSGTFNGLVGHAYYYMIIKLDSENQITETNKTNNTYSWYGTYVYR